MSELSVSTESMKRVQLVSVSGRVDSSTAQQFDSAIQSLFDQGHYNLVLNLSEVNYMSSAGLRTLVSAMKESKRHGGKIALSSLSDRVEEVLELAGLNSLFDIYEENTAAVGSF